MIEDALLPSGGALIAWGETGSAACGRLVRFGWERLWKVQVEAHVVEPGTAIIDRATGRWMLTCLPSILLPGIDHDAGNAMADEVRAEVIAVIDPVLGLGVHRDLRHPAVRATGVVARVQRPRPWVQVLMAQTVGALPTVAAYAA